MTAESLTVLDIARVLEIATARRDRGMIVTCHVAAPPPEVSLSRDSIRAAVERARRRVVNAINDNYLGIPEEIEDRK